jgi:hypothetical protein
MIQGVKEREAYVINLELKLVEMGKTIKRLEGENTALSAKVNYSNTGKV